MLSDIGIGNWKNNGRTADAKPGIEQILKKENVGSAFPIGLAAHPVIRRHNKRRAQVIKLFKVPVDYRIEARGLA